MGRRSRKAGRTATEPRAAPPGAERVRADPAQAYSARAAKSQARNDAVRAELVPLEPGEYPPALKAAIGTCAVLAVIGVVRLLTVDDIGESLSYFLLMEAVIAAAGIGMYLHRYWALLGFQTLLMLQIIFASILLPLSRNLIAIPFCIAIIAYCGWLFWKLIRVMARVQMPQARRRP